MHHVQSLASSMFGLVRRGHTDSFKQGFTPEPLIPLVDSRVRNIPITQTSHLNGIVKLSHNIVRGSGAHRIHLCLLAAVSLL